MQLSSFKTYVKYDFKRSDKDTELVQCYNDSIMAIAVKMPHGDYKYQSYVATVIGQEDYPLPSSLIHLIHPIRLLEGSGTNDSGWPLNHIDKEAYDILEPNPNRTSPSKGQPSDYTIYSKCILVTPIPDKATYLLEINWALRPTALSADADLHSLGAEWDEVLKQMTLSRLFRSLQMYDEADRWRAMYEIQDAYGNVIPVGLYRDLLDNEQSREGWRIGQIKSNSL